jgi:phosphatidate cytidylyltransferase
MTLELKKRMITSTFLFLLLILMYLYSFVLIISLIIIATISWIEFYALISKIYLKKKSMHSFFRAFFKVAFLVYIYSLVCLILIIESQYTNLKIFVLYSILVSVASDIGGLIIGKIFKGKKLTKISPNKTISGSIGSFIFSLILIPFFITNIPEVSYLIFIIITLIISLTSQLGDLAISFLKRKAKVNDTSDLLPGHGGVLDRIDGIIIALPVGILLFNLYL